MDKNKECPECGQALIVYEFNWEDVCLKCGHVLKKEKLLSDTMKIVEENGAAKKIFHNESSFTPSLSHGNDIIYKRKKRVEEILILCEQFSPLNNEEKQDIIKKLDFYFEKSKELCHNLKALVSAVFYAKLVAEKRYLPIKEFLGEMNLKNKVFLKYAQNFKKILPCADNCNTSSSWNFEDIFDRIFNKLKNKNLLGQKTLYSPSGCIGQEIKPNLFDLQGCDREENLTKIRGMLYSKTRELYNNENLNFLKNGKSPYNFVSTLVAIVCNYFEFPLKKTELSEILEVPYCTLLRGIREVEEEIVLTVELLKKRESEKIKQIFQISKPGKKKLSLKSEQKERINLGIKFIKVVNEFLRKEKYPEIKEEYKSSN